MKTSVSNAELACRMVRNTINYARNQHGINGSIFYEDDSIAKFISDYPVAWMNAVFKFNPKVKPVSDQVRRVLDEYEQRQSPMTWYIGPLTAESEVIKEALKVHGVKYCGYNVCMVLDPAKLSYSQPAPELQIEQVDQVEKISDWLKPFAIAFSVPEIVQNHFAQLINSRMHAREEVYLVGYIDERPVCSGSYFIDNEVIMFYSGCTLPEYRRRGYGRQMAEARVRHAFKQAQLPVVLQTAPDGEAIHLFRKMGFLEFDKQEKYLFDVFNTSKP